MADESAPASLPFEHRAKAPAAPTCAQDMRAGQFTVSETSIRIDKTWGVWIDPKAPAFTTQPTREAPIIITHYDHDDYMVDLSYAKSDLKKVWVASLMESFADQGFLPARYVS
jgi:hypothetical protein